MATVIRQVLSADGETSEAKSVANVLYISGLGSFGGGTLTIQVYDKIGDLWTALQNTDGTDVAYTSNFTDNLDLPTGTRIRYSLSGATSPSINCYCDNYVR